VDVEVSRITGIIDYTEAAITDPARDLALIYRDLGLGRSRERWPTTTSLR
jgi:aminoglycoside phosphotransferase (APT) family kinase protein